MNNAIVKLIAGLSFVLATQQAAAYSTWVCEGYTLRWDNRPITMRLHSAFSSGSGYRNAMTSAINIFNQNPSVFRMNKSFNDTSVGFGNNQNEIWFTNQTAALGGDNAKTFVQYTCIDYWIFGETVRLDEMDIIYDNTVNFSTSTNKNNLTSHGGNRLSFHAVSVHELGHASALAHTNNTYNVMGDSYRHAISQFRRTGASGEYSVHAPTRVLNGNGAGLATRNDNGERGYRVNRGQAVRLELTYENNGSTFQTEDVRFYVSTNNIISTADRLIASATFDLGRNTVLTTTSNLTIPSNLTRGRFYYLGAIIDANGTLGEAVENNNAARIPIWIN